MKNSIINILIAEPSSIIFEGLANILAKTNEHFNILKAEMLTDLHQISMQTKIDVVLINPSLIVNQLKTFHSLKKDLENTQWIGIIYSFYDHQISVLFDGLISINDSPNHILTSINKLLNTKQPEQNHQPETLSEREVAVLKLLVAGNSNKEIADKLFISTHTVISHRKNISQKTGIKSVSGLTIYAVVNNIISLNN